MMARNGEDPELRSGSLSVSGNTEAGKARVLRPDEVPLHLRDVAILTVGPTSYAEDAAWPVEVGIAYCGGAPGGAWLVEPDDQWAPSISGMRCWSVASFRSGLPGALVAEQLRDSVREHRVFSRDHRTTAAWIRHLFSACGVDGAFEVWDLRSLIVSARSPDGWSTIANLEWADQQALRLAPDLPRVVLHAVRDATALLLLSGMTEKR